MNIQELSDSEIKLIKSVLKEYLQSKCLDLYNLLKNEEHRRTVPELSGPEVIKKFLFRYVKFEIPGGIGGYEVWKVSRVNDYGNKTYSLYPDKPIVSNIDGIYSIDTYLEDLTIETSDDLKRLTVITEEEYLKEFENALEYYKSLLNK